MRWPWSVLPPPERRLPSAGHIGWRLWAQACSLPGRCAASTSTIPPIASAGFARTVGPDGSCWRASWLAGSFSEACLPRTALDAETRVGVVDRCPGPPRPFRLSLLVSGERSVALFRLTAGGGGKASVGIFSADHPVGALLLALLLDAPAGMSVVDAGPGTARPFGFGIPIVGERSKASFRAAAYDIDEASVGIFAADYPERHG